MLLFFKARITFKIVRVGLFVACLFTCVSRRTTFLVYHCVPLCLRMTVPTYSLSRDALTGPCVPGTVRVHMAHPCLYRASMLTLVRGGDKKLSEKVAYPMC